MKERVVVEQESFVPLLKRLQSCFRCFEKDVLTILTKVTVYGLAMVSQIFLASKAFVAEFTHNWWGRKGLASRF